MSNLRLKVGCYEYDHTRALFDGTVKFDAIDATLNRPTWQARPSASSGCTATMRVCGPRAFWRTSTA